MDMLDSDGNDDLTKLEFTIEVLDVNVDGEGSQTSS